MEDVFPPPPNPLVGFVNPPTLPVEAVRLKIDPPRFTDLKARLDELEERVRHLESRLEASDIAFEDIKSQLDESEDRVRHFESRLEDVEGALRGDGYYEP